MNKDIRYKIKEAFALISTKKALTNITITEICNKVPIARTTFYTHFQDIHEVIDEIEEELIKGFLIIYEDFVETDFSKYKFGDSMPVLEDTLFYIKSNMIYFKAFIGSYPNLGFIEKWKQIIKNSFKKIWKKESITYDNQELVLEMIASSAIGAYSYWVHHEKEIEFKKMSKELSSRYYMELFIKNQIYQSNIDKLF